MAIFNSYVCLPEGIEHPKTSVITCNNIIVNWCDVLLGQSSIFLTDPLPSPEGITHRVEYMTNIHPSGHLDMRKAERWPGHLQVCLGQRELGEARIFRGRAVAIWWLNGAWLAWVHLWFKKYMKRMLDLHIFTWYTVTYTYIHIYI